MDRFRYLIGTGGIGSGMFLQLRGEHTLGRCESRAGTILPRRDFCKLHIIAHYVSALMGGRGAQPRAAVPQGFRVLPVGKVGQDDIAGVLLEQMRRAGMDTRFVAAVPGRPTLFSVCFAYPDGEAGNITTDDSASSAVTPEDIDRAFAALPDAVGDLAGGMTLAAPEVPLPARRRLLELGRRHGLFNAAAFTSAELAEAADTGMFALADLVSLNRDEAAALCRSGIPARHAIEQSGKYARLAPASEDCRAGMPDLQEMETIARAAAEQLWQANPEMMVCITAGGEGAYGFHRGRMEFGPPCKVRVASTAGAGDAMLGGIIAGLARGLPFVLPDRPRRTSLADAPLATALDLGTLVSAMSVESEDTINFDISPRSLADFARQRGLSIDDLRLTI